MKSNYPHPLKYHAYVCIDTNKKDDILYIDTLPLDFFHETIYP